ncbi:hypothetical protein GCM10028856_15850 [Halopiger thermotolerans]
MLWLVTTATKIRRYRWRPIGAAVALLLIGVEVSRMPSVELDEETIERLDELRVDDESYDELITELINIYETSEYTLFRAGD